MRKKILFLAAMTAVASANAQSFMVDGHEAVDLGLSVLWATCNVGADSPEEFGGKYFENFDVAQKEWGGAWRMPTYLELMELTNNCYSENTNYNGTIGRIYYKKKSDNDYYNTADAHIFLPAAGYNETSNGVGYYWNILWGTYLITKSNSIDNVGKDRKSVRAVCEKSAVTGLNYVEKENANTVYKTFENGQIVIVKNGVKYNLRGHKL